MAEPAGKLSEEERQRLYAEGYRSVEIWVFDLNDPQLVAEIQAEARLIAEADRRTGMDKVLDAFAADLLAHEPDYEW
jgi:hypothetical protein